MILLKDRNLSKLEFYNTALNIRLRVTSIFLNQFCVEDIEFKTQTYTPATEAVKSHQKWVVTTIREAIMHQLVELINNITDAYSIYPTTIHEWEVRRDYQTAAIGNCEKLLQHFQFVLELFNENPYNLFTGKRVNVDKLLPYADDICKEIQYLKGWRKAGNKLRTEIEKKKN